MECRVRQVTASEADTQWVKEFTAAARDRAGVGGEGSSMWDFLVDFKNIYIFYFASGSSLQHVDSYWQHVGSSSLTRGGTQAPCIGSTKS